MNEPSLALTAAARGGGAEMHFWFGAAWHEVLSPANKSADPMVGR